MNFGDERWTFLFLFYRRILPTIPFYHSCPTPLCIQLQGTLLCYLRKTARSDIRYDANLHVILLLYAFITRSFLSFLPLVHATCCQHIRQAESMSCQALLYYSYNYYYYHFCFVFCDAFSLILPKFIPYSNTDIQMPFSFVYISEFQVKIPFVIFTTTSSVVYRNCTNIIRSTCGLTFI